MEKNIIKFEVGKIYFCTRNEETIQISRRTEKTVWFCDDCLSARIEIRDGVEAVRPIMGIIRKTYWSNKCYN